MHTSQQTGDVELNITPTLFEHLLYAGIGLTNFSDALHHQARLQSFLIRSLVDLAVIGNEISS